MKITRITCHVLLVPQVNADACSSAQDNLVVEIHTDAGLTGIGETDVNPWIARAAIESPSTHVMGRGLAEMLVGADPSDIGRLWDKLYSGSKMNGRRGAVIAAMGALDMALWDLRGKALNQPVWRLLGVEQPRPIQPYASLLGDGTTPQEYQTTLAAKLRQAIDIGFTAAKLELSVSGPYSHNGVQMPDAAMVDMVAQCRQVAGPDITLMGDLVYAFDDAARCLRLLEKLAPYNLFFIETPLNMDDLDGYAYLAKNAPMPVAAGEWQNTHWEFIELADRGVQVLQPDVGRVGGFTEALKVCDLARQRGYRIVPHCWKTGLGLAATAHLAAATPHCPFIEFLPAALSDSRLRQEMTLRDVDFAGGMVHLSDRPGLGVELNHEALARYRQP